MGLDMKKQILSIFLAIALISVGDCTPKTTVQDLAAVAKPHQQLASTQPTAFNITSSRTSNASTTYHMATVTAVICRNSKTCPTGKATDQILPLKSIKFKSTEPLPNLKVVSPPACKISTTSCKAALAMCHFQSAIDWKNAKSCRPTAKYFANHPSTVAPASSCDVHDGHGGHGIDLDCMKNNSAPVKASRMKNAKINQAAQR